MTTISLAPLSHPLFSHPAINHTSNSSLSTLVFSFGPSDASIDPLISQVKPRNTTSPHPPAKPTCPSTALDWLPTPLQSLLQTGNTALTPAFVVAWPHIP
jgi:hypothetical protein